ncbi:hypothetical protein C6Y54_08415 [Bacillus cereus]|nr:hypothetical protein C6Y54_08415 [Bacillus cereus]
MDLTLCEEAIDFENLNTGVFQLLKHVFIHWFNRTESYRTIRKRTWRYLSSFLSRYLPGSKTPTSKFSESKEVRWGMIKVSLYLFQICERKTY